jgi:hypothetical protein
LLQPDGGFPTQHLTQTSIVAVPTAHALRSAEVVALRDPFASNPSHHVDQFINRYEFIRSQIERVAVKRPPILAGLGLVAARQPAAVVAVEMWEPACNAGFQAPGKGSANPVWDSPRFTRRVISTANLRILPILMRSGHWVRLKSKNVTFQKAA